MTAQTDLEILLKTMSPVLQSGEYVFCSVTKMPDIDTNQLVLTFRETEGTTIILKKETADQLNLSYSFVSAWITLRVHSSLNAVGFTAAFSNALSQKGISCNVIAGYYHDHIFVNSTEAKKAMEVLESISG